MTDAEQAREQHYSQPPMRYPIPNPNGWPVWAIRGVVAVLVAIAGWTANRVVNTLDSHSETLTHVQRSVESIHQTQENLSTTVLRELEDHETRLRQDREILTTHGSTIQNEANRILSLEQTRELQARASQPLRR